MRPRLRPLPLVLAGLGLGACASEPPYPGDVVVGLFSFHAQADRTDCDPDAGDFSRLTDGGFDFSGTFSRESVDGGAWLTVNGFSRPAAYDPATQRYVSVQNSGAPVPSCGEGCQGARMEETLSVVVLSGSQSQAVGTQCANLPGDGGLPAGAVPGPTVNGYDAEKACGDLRVTFVPGTAGNCKCTVPCTAVYGVEGERRFNGGQ